MHLGNLQLATNASDASHAAGKAGELTSSPFLYSCCSRALPRTEAAPEVSWRPVEHSSAGDNAAFANRTRAHVVAIIVQLLQQGLAQDGGGACGPTPAWRHAEKLAVLDHARSLQALCLCAVS